LQRSKRQRPDRSLSAGTQGPGARGQRAMIAVDNLRTRMLRRMRELVLPGEAATPRERQNAMRDAVERFRKVEREIAQNRWRMDERILEHLNPSQRVRYLLFNERFERELRERIGAVREKGRRGARPDAPGPMQPPEMPE
jgi:hypothetical protein